MSHEVRHTNTTYIQAHTKHFKLQDNLAKLSRNFLSQVHLYMRIIKSQFLITPQVKCWGKKDDVMK